MQAVINLNSLFNNSSKSIQSVYLDKLLLDFQFKLLLEYSDKRVVIPIQIYNQLLEFGDVVCYRSSLLKLYNFAFGISLRVNISENSFKSLLKDFEASEDFLSIFVLSVGQIDTVVPDERFEPIECQFYQVDQCKKDLISFIRQLFTIHMNIQVQLGNKRMKLISYAIKGLRQLNLYRFSGEAIFQ